MFKKMTILSTFHHYLLSPKMNISSLYQSADRVIAEFMARNGIKYLRMSLGLVFLWFGFLKFFPNLSPAQELATRTIDKLTVGQIPPHVAIVLLAAWECLIGLGLLFPRYLRITLFLLFTQMLGTITPIFFFPSDVFLVAPYVPTLEGQYIIKNLVLISAGIVIGGTVRSRHPGSESRP